MARGRLIVAAVLLMLAVTMAGMSLLGPSSLFGARSSVASRAASSFGRGQSSLLAMLGLRSPGERSQGQLADTKAPKTPLAGAGGPHERALAKVRPPVPSIKLISLTPVAPQGIEGLPPGLLVQPGSIPASGGGDLAGSFPPSGAGPVFLGSFPGGGGGGGGGGSIVTPETPPVTSAVPEPSSWTLMILGLGAIGASLRRNRRRRALPHPLGALAGPR